LVENINVILLDGHCQKLKIALFVLRTHYSNRLRLLYRGWQFHAKPSSQAAGVSQTLTIHDGEPGVSLEELKDEYEELRASLHVFTKLPAIPEEEEQEREEDGGVACVGNPDVVGVEIEPVKAKSTDGY